MTRTLAVLLGAVALMTAFGFLWASRDGSVLDGVLWIVATYVGTAIGIGLVAAITRVVR